MKETDDDPEDLRTIEATSVDDAKLQEKLNRFRAPKTSNPAGSIGEGDLADERIENEKPLDARIQELAAREAESLHGKAIDAEPAVTRDLTEVARSAGSELDGLDDKLKGESSLQEKLTKFPIVGKQRNDPAKALTGRGRRVNDALRYTVISTEERYMSARSDVHHRLEARGYAMKKFTNSWVSPDGSIAEPYRGINETWSSPEGYSFEIQFHTAASFDMKNSNHPLYKELRRPDTPLPRAQEVAGIMSGRFDGVPVPPGALDGPRRFASIAGRTITRGGISPEREQQG